MELCWNAIHVRSRHEFRVEERLGNAGLEAFLPTMERLSNWKDRKKVVTFPLFPGYLFVHIGSEPRERLKVLKTNGVVRFLGLTNNEPEPVPEEQIMSLKRLVDKREKIDPYPYLKGGQRVRIKKGPLAGVEGTLVERLGQHMLVISIDLLQQGAALRIDATDVERV